jgi:hypothetical protein
MGFITYFVGLALSGPVAILLMTFIHWLIHRWCPKNEVLWQRITRVALRAFPFAVAFAPTLLMKRGMGVLIPASDYLLPTLVGLPFHRLQPLDTDDRDNLSTATISFMVVWCLASFIIFVRQKLVARKKSEHELQA